MLKKYRFVIVGCGLLAGLLSLGSGTLQAHGGADGVVKERMMLMKSAADEMKLIADMVKGKRPFNTERVSRGADTIAHNAARLERLFPPNSLDKPTEALPAIWEQWDRFSGLAAQMRHEADKLGEQAQAGEQRQVMRQFARLGKVCSGCHTDFRKKQEKI